MGLLVARAPQRYAQPLVVASWGGAYQTARGKALFEPFEKEFNVHIVEASTPGLRKDI